MNIIRVPHPFEIVKVDKNKIVINEGFVYTADKLERFDVEDIVSVDGPKSNLKKVWQSSLPSGYSYTIPENQELIFSLEIEHDDPAGTSFLKSCSIVKCRIALEPEVRKESNFSSMYVGTVYFDAKSSITTIKQHLNSDVFFFKWGELNSI